MFRTIADFEKVWAGHVAGTMRVLAALTDESLSQAVADDHRTLGRMAWHNVTTYPEMMKHVGMKVESVAENAPVPATAAEIRGTYKAVTDEFLKQIKAGWRDETLEVIDDLYGEKWKRGQTLNVLIAHEIHHRGQMTVLMRQAGLKVPGIFGPAKEEWTKYGMTEPEV
jgi:uncharacterized damage-inducible protein DinB